MVRQKLNNKGFTFVELIVSIAILGIVMVSVASFLGTTTTVYSRTNHETSVQSQAQEVYDQINSCIMQATKVIVYGYRETAAGADTYQTDKKFYVTDNQKNAYGYDDEGNIISVNKKKLNYTIYLNPNGTPSGSPGAVRVFQSLKESDGAGGYEYKKIRVESLYIEYQTKVSGSSDYVTCYATFNFDKDTGELYLNRHYSNETDVDGKYQVTSGDKALAILDTSKKDENILCKTMKKSADSFILVADADGNCVGMSMDFDNYSMTYDSMGMIRIRNKNVLTR